jgi:carbonic anhydrase
LIEIGWKLCIPESTATVEMAESEPVKAGEHGAIHWGYSGDIGPEFWGDLSAEYALCSTGARQSPIDISGATPQEGGITFNYQPTNLNLLNNGHTIQVNYDAGSSIEVNGETYNLFQFHFHVPSEHTENGLPAAMELHLVHRNADDKLAVVGVMMNVGAENPVLARFWDQIPAEETEITVPGTINIAEALPGGLSYYTYDGSLTTPPCSEGVSWFVLNERIEASQTQIDKFVSIIGNNARPVQPLNDRVIGQMAEGNF